MKALFTLSLSVLIAVSIIYTIWLFSEIPNRYNNNFNRIYFDNFAQPIASRKFTIPPQSILSYDDSNAIFTTDSLGLLLKSNQFLSKITKERFFLEKNELVQKNRNHQTFAYGNLFFTLSTSKKLLTSFDADASSSKTYKIPFMPIYTVSPMPEVIIFTSRKNNKTTLFSFNLLDLSVKTNATVILPLDSTLYADGQLITDPITKWISYVPYYHNSVITFDTAFNTIAEFRTIDTISHDIVALKNSNSAPLVINQKSTMYNGFLFVASNLKADNEPLATYKKNIPIDVYDNLSGQYLKSFYIPLSNGKLIKSFLILPNNVLFVLYHDNWVKTFHLNFAKLVCNN